ncbi:MAG: GNAT family N-acetyltransferase [Planctomycetota bacterium]
MKQPALQTERLILRAFRQSDTDDYAALCADPEVMRYISPQGPLTRAEAWRKMAMHLGHWQLRGFGQFVLEERATGRFLGHAGPHQPEGWPGREIGWVLARYAWGQGFAYEAARAACAYAFDTLAWDRVISLIAPENERSIRLALRLGERLDGQVTVIGITANVYALTRAEYDSQHAETPR